MWIWTKRLFTWSVLAVLSYYGVDGAIAAGDLNATAQDQQIATGIAFLFLATTMAIRSRRRANKNN